jgi:hypothetical protein
MGRLAITGRVVAGAIRAWLTGTATGRKST